MTTSGLRRTASLSGIALILLIIGADAYEAWQDYRLTLVQSELAINALALTLGEQATRMVQEIDVILSEMEDWSEASAIPGHDDVSALQARLKRRVANLPFVVSAAILPWAGDEPGKKGAGAATAADIYAGALSIRDPRAYVGPAHAGPGDTGPTFALSRALRAPTGEVRAVVTVRVSFEYLSRFYAAADVAPGASIRLIRSDGIVLARYPWSLESRAPDPFVRFAATPSPDARARVVTSADGTGALLARRAINGYPMAIEIVQPMRTALAAWRVQETASSVRTGSLAVFSALLLAALSSALRRRERAEAAQEHMESQLRAAQQADTLGVFAASIAHDFNNILAAIIGFAALVRGKIPADSPAIANLDRLLATADRARSLVRRVLSFDLRRQVRSRPFALEPIVTEVLGQISATHPTGIDIRSRGLDAASRLVRGDSTEIHQVVMNLCTNAIQAMTGGGVLEVAVDTVVISAPATLAVGELNPGTWARLSVIDQGVGMSARQMRTMFDPFVSMKPGSRGSGLGLAVVRNIVGSMGGAVGVTSREGQGTRFEVFWRIVPAAELQATQAAAAPGRGQSILIVDDDESLVNIAEELLASLGYEPVGFSDPQLALDALKSEPQRFDAILTDEHMPQMRGTQFAREARLLNAAIPVVLVTAHREQGVESRARAAGIHEVLDKPLHIGQLARVFSGLFAVVSQRSEPSTNANEKIG